MDLISVGVAAIFAREFLEAAIIIGNFRTIIRKSGEPEDVQRRAHRIVWCSAAVAFLLAFVMILATGIGLSLTRKNFSIVAAEIIEGVSKVVAAVAILLLSLKIPGWLGLYDATPDKEAEEHANQGAIIAAYVGCIKMFDPEDPMEPNALKFNVGWNIWREMAEIGAFLFPYFLREGQDPLLIPVSAVIGIGIALVLGLGLYWANKSFTNKAPLAAFMSVITGWLATGLFTGGMHEFEEAVYYAGAGPMTPRVFEIPGEWAAHWRLPMTIFKPFGYSKYPTVLMMVSFWSYAALTVGLHYRQWYINKKNKEAAAAKEGGKDDAALSQTDGAGGEPRAEA